MSEEAKHTPISPCPEYAAAFICFREALAWGCEPEDAMASALEEYRSASYAELSTLRTKLERAEKALADLAKPEQGNDICDVLANYRRIRRTALSSIRGEDAPKDDGWIEWKGDGEQPVPAGTPMEARLRSGEVVYGKDWIWGHHGIPSDIVAYRVVKP